MEVEDNGVGASVEPNSVVGSGRSIINALIGGELGGRVAFASTHHGTRVRVVLPT
jgi:two-component sensor histidine kinase